MIVFKKLLIVFSIIISICNCNNLNSAWTEMCSNTRIYKVWEGYRPAANNSAGDFSLQEGIEKLDPCIESCCQDVTCNVVFMYKQKCYQINCVSNQYCMPIYNPEFGKKVQMVLVRPVGSKEWPREDYDDGDGDPMLADSAVNLDNKACEVALANCPNYEKCESLLNSHSRAGVCVCIDGYIRNHSGYCEPFAVEGGSNESLANKLSLPMLQQSSDLLKSNTQSQSIQPTPATIVKKLTVSVVSKEIRLPENSVTLSAYTVPAESDGDKYGYEWKLLSQPADSTGTMENAASSKLSLAHLSQGLYQFKVSVTGTNAAGEAFANVSVLPQMRVNQAPVAVVTPERQTIKLPNSEGVLDASSSSDDEGVVSYHWEVTQAPLGYAPQLEDSPTLQLHNLTLPGNYSYRLTVKDKQGLSSQAQAFVTVVKETDYPPEANAGQDVILYLPRNALVLNGNRSTDDKGISSWEWTKASSDSNKAVDMQDTRTPYLKLSDLEAGVYTFVLKVTDTAGQSSTAEVHVFVKQPSHLPPTADAGSDKTIAFPRNWIILESQSTPTSNNQNQQNSAAASSGDGDDLLYQWTQIKGPASARFIPKAANISKVNATTLTRGTYVFKLEISDPTSGLSANDTVTVNVLQNTNAQPKASAGGDKTVTLPFTVLTLNGSNSSDDLAVTKWQWSWDGSSLAQGTILADSDKTPILMIGGVVPGQYVFKLRVEDEQGLSAEDTATIIIKPDPQINSLVRITLGAASRNLRRSQLTSLLRQISLLLHGGVTVTLRTIEEEKNTGRAVITFLAERKDHDNNEVLSGTSVVQGLRAKLRQDPSLLDLSVAHIETVVCQNNCSGHGVCDEATRQCLCEAFWMQDLLEQYFGDGESNCDWSLLYVVVAATAILLGLCGLSWAAYCLYGHICLRDNSRSKLRVTKQQNRRRASYSLLGSQEEEETGLGSTILSKGSRSLSLSDTDSDVLFETRTKTNGTAVRNGNSKPLGPKIGRKIKA